MVSLFDASGGVAETMFDSIIIDRIPNISD